MNQSLLQAEVLLRHQARERDNHIEEGRVLRALHAPAEDRARGQEVSAGRVEQSTGVRALMSRLWRAVRLPSPPEAHEPFHTNSPLLRAAE